MRRKHWFVAIAVLFVAGGLWFARTAWRPDAFDKSSTGVGPKTPQETHFDSHGGASLAKASRSGAAAGPNNRSGSRHVPRPPDQSRRFRDFTPEERVEFARKGRGPGG